MKLNKNITALLTAATASMMIASPVMAYEAGDIVVRGRILLVDPQDDSNSITIDGVSQGTEATVNSDVIPEIDFTYMLTSNWGLELILGYSDHEVKTNLFGLGKIGETKVLPPTLTLQYHFMPTSNIRPYAGVGVNYTHFFDSEVKGGLDAPGADLDIDDSFGLALQAGVDVDITEDWFVNFDVKYIDMSADATIKNGARIKVDIDVDPIVWGIGVGTTF